MNKILTLLFVALTSLSCLAGDMKARHLPTLSQIPEHNITKIFCDSDGYMWYATDNSLFRDDGYDIVTIKLGSDCVIRDMNQDLSGNLWISTDKGAFVIDRGNYAVTPFDRGRLKDMPVNNVFTTSDGSIWVNQYGVLRRYDHDLNWLKDYPIAGKGNKGYVTGFSERAPGDIFMTCYSNGVYRYNKARDMFEMFAPTENNVKLGELLYDDKHDWFWTNDHEGVLYRFSPYPTPKEPLFVASEISHYSTPDIRERLHHFTIDKDKGYLWCITRNHLLAFEPQPDGRLQPVRLAVTDNFDGVSVQDVLATPGLLWVASFDQPCTVISLQDNNVTFDSLDILRRRSGNRPLITHLAQDSNGNQIWMIQLRTGLVLYNRGKNTLIYNDETSATKNLRLNVANNLTSSQLHGGVWVSQERRGILRAMSGKDNSMFQVDSVVLTTPVDINMRVKALYEDTKGRIWAATSQGVYSYDLDSRQFVLHAPDLTSGSALTEDSDGNIWLAAKDSCIYKFPAGNVHTRTAYTLPGFFSAISSGADGRIWVGADDGKLYSFDTEKEKFEYHPGLNDILESQILRITVGNDGRIWILTEQQLVEYNPSRQTFNLYSGGTDVDAERFLNTSMTHNGNILLGAIGGIATITPSQNPESTSGLQPPMVTDVSIDGRSRLFTDSLDLTDTKKLHISSNDRNIVIHLSNHDNINAGKVRYAYRLKGFDKQWTITRRGDNKAVYNYLPKGTYTLEAKSCDPHNKWSEPVEILTIERKPALYETWWASTLVILFVIVGIAYAIHRYRRHVLDESEEIWSDSAEMVKMRKYIESPVSLPDEEFRHLDSLLVSKATEVVEAHMSEPEFDVNDLASGCNMSRSSFTRKIKAITNQTPLEFIKDIKIKHARHMLESQNYTVSEVAEKLGFTNRRYFTATFRKATGINPSEYLRDRRDDDGNDKNEPEGD